MPNTGVNLVGEKTLLRKFRSLGRRLQTSTLVRATKPGAKIILDRARQLAPRLTGKLATTGLQLKVTRRRKMYGETSVTNTQPDGAHAILQEYGVGPHRVNGKAHPGHKAQPFMRPAFDEKVGDARDEVSRNLHREILQAAK